jgi:hypothetical protein
MGDVVKDEPSSTEEAAKAQTQTDASVEHAEAIVENEKTEV